MTENSTSWLLALPSLVFIFTSESAFLFHTKKHMFAVQQICQPQFCQWYSGIKGLFSISPPHFVVKAGDVSALDKAIPINLWERSADLFGDPPERAQEQCPSAF